MGDDGGVLWSTFQLKILVFSRPLCLSFILMSVPTMREWYLGKSQYRWHVWLWSAQVCLAEEKLKTEHEYWPFSWEKFDWQDDTEVILKIFATGKAFDWLRKKYIRECVEGRDPEPYEFWLCFPFHDQLYHMLPP